MLVKLKENSHDNGFALMLEQSDGTYEESTSNSWSNDGSYFFNNELSGCIDTDGNKIDNSLSFDSNTNLVTISTNKTSYCYLYFDRDKVVPGTFIFYLGGNSNPTYVRSAGTTAYLSWTDADISSYCLTTTNSSTNCTWTTTSGTSVTPSYTLTSGDETKTVYAFLKDKAGNTSSAVSDTITLDTTSPVISSVTKTSDEKTSISVSVTASDAFGIQTYYYQLGSGSAVSSTNNTYTFSGLTAGTSYTIKVYTKDNAGNISSAATKTFTTKPETMAEKLISTVSSSELWNSTLEDDGYRYVGTNPNNYICFGTTNKTTCTSDTDKYMYRIIGIFADSSGNQHVKLIKKEALNTVYSWNTSEINVEWNSSSLYNGLNGSYFLTNKSYSYMQDNIWINKIATWNYTMTNTKTFDALTYGGEYGIDYSYNTVQVVYFHELNRTVKSSQVCYSTNGTNRPDAIVDCNVGTWINLSTRISLMYVSDYQLSLGNNALEYDGYNNAELLKKGWMHLENNDSNLPDSEGIEWTMSRSGARKKDYRAYAIWYNGNISRQITSDNYHFIRPVFYLEHSVELKSGIGSLNDPYIIK